MEEYVKKSLSYWKRLNRKIADKPQVMQILQKRTFNSAFAVLENLKDIPFTELSMSLYFYCQDVAMNKFTRLYEAQVELAGIDPEKFMFQLHKFFNDLSNRIKKENLYSEFFELYYQCNKIRLTKKDIHINKKVILAYLSLLAQTTEYLRPNKFDFTTIIAGRKTTGELITIKDAYPLLDMGGYEAEQFIESNPSVRIDPNDLIRSCYKKYGYEIKDLNDLNIITNIDKIYGTTISTMIPFINEYTYDILPESPFIPEVSTFFVFHSKYPFTDLTTRLTKRKRTLPANGVVIKFNKDFPFKEVLLKEILYDNSIFMLYNLKTHKGDMVGFYDTKEKFFFNALADYEDKTLYEAIGSLVLYLYGCYTLDTPDIQITKTQDYFSFASVKLEAEGYLQGGKLKNRLDPSTEKESVSGVARKGNDAFTTETRAIQGFIRHLPEGKQPSEKAIALAESLGYDLAPNETYVQPFIKQVFKLKFREEEK